MSIGDIGVGIGVLSCKVEGSGNLIIPKKNQFFGFTPPNAELGYHGPIATLANRAHLRDFRQIVLRFHHEP